MILGRRSENCIILLMNNFINCLILLIFQEINGTVPKCIFIQVLN